MGRVELEVACAVGVEDEVDSAALVEDIDFRAGNDCAGGVCNGSMDGWCGRRGGGGVVCGEREGSGGEEEG